MAVAGGVLPLALAVLVRAIQINGVEAVVVPDCCGPGRLDVAHQAAGLKIWGGWHFLNHRTEKPLFANAKTLAMARHIYGISEPDDEQKALFLVTSLSQLGQAFLRVDFAIIGLI